MPVLYRKSWLDIRRRWARSVFTIATIAAAVAGMALFALPTLMDRAMNDRIAHDRLHDIRIYTRDVVLTDADVAALHDWPGVDGVALRTVYATKVYAGERREDVLLVGVQDFAAQEVNVVGLQGGDVPGPGEALTDSQNARSGRLNAAPGATVEVEDSAAVRHSLAISGSGRTLEFSQVALEDSVVLYASQATVNEIAGRRGIDSIELRVDNPENAQAVTDAVQAWLLEQHPDIVFTNLPDTRVAGTWPGQDVFNNFSTLFYVGAILAFISAVALISNTMTTMVAEQTREIAILKAIGGRRRQVGFSFLRTVALLAIAGSLVGVAIGIPFSNLLARYVGAEFLGVTPGWGVAWIVVALSLVVGVVGTTAAAVPALVRASRLPVREGLKGPAAATPGRLPRALRIVPLPAAASIGLRNISRRKARAAGTTVQVGLAVGIALGFLALGITIARLTADTWDTLRWDVIVSQNSNVPLDDRAAQILENLDGVAVAQPLLYNNLQVGGEQYEAWGIRPGADLYEPNIGSGRWLDPADNQERARVAVIGHALAASNGLGVGDTMVAGTARGPAGLTIVGIDDTLMNNGTTIFVPFESFQDILGRADTNAYWLVAASRDEGAIDRVAADAEDSLNAAGYPVRTEIRYVEKRANLASNRTLVGVLAVMGIPIVAIGLIGLVNMMTMNVIERTREIGILRCIGAGAKDISRIFRAEALAVAALGWVLAVPLGWVIGKTLVVIIANLFEFGSIPYTFPAWYVPIALVATLGLAWLVVIPPLRRASRLRPGDALRYE